MMHLCLRRPAEALAEARDERREATGCWLVKAAASRRRARLELTELTSATSCWARQRARDPALRAALRDAGRGRASADDRALRVPAALSLTAFATLLLIAP
jgi:hypothetical protein